LPQKPHVDVAATVLLINKAISKLLSTATQGQVLGS